MHIISKFNRVNSLKTTKDVQSMLVLINVDVIDFKKTLPDGDISFKAFHLVTNKVNKKIFE